MQQFKREYVGIAIFILIWLVVLGGIHKRLSQMKPYDSDNGIKMTITREDRVLVVKTYNQSLDILLDDEIICSLEPIEKDFLSERMSGKWNFVEIHTKKREGTLQIINKDTKENSEKVEFFLSSSRKSAFKEILEKDCVWVILAIVLVGIGLVTYLMYCYIGKEKRSKRIFFFETFFFMLGTWFFMECGIFQFLVENKEIYRILYYEIEMLLAIPFLWYIRYDENEKKKIIDKLLILLIITFLINNILYISGKMDFVKTIVVTKVMLCIIILMMVYTKHAKIQNIVSITAIIIIDVIMILTQQEKGREILAKNVIVFVIAIFTIKKFFETKKLVVIGKRVKEWERLAHQDALTRTYNRAAYDEYIEDIMENQIDCNNIAIISCDVNNLKLINDTYGHSEGDNYLIRCVNAINSVISEKSSIYRTGGDEFIIIMNPYEKGQVMKYSAGFEKILNKKCDVKEGVSFAYGYAYYKKEIDNNIIDTIKRADANMYKKKIEMKEKKMVKEEKFD